MWTCFTACNKPEQWYVHTAAASQAAKPLLSFLQVAAAQTSLDANKEELFDVISCYFPISFSPPPNSVHAITRQDLAAALQDALTCTPLFAPLFIPMLVEKLCSSLRCLLLHSSVDLEKTFKDVACWVCPSQITFLMT